MSRVRQRHAARRYPAVAVLLAALIVALAAAGDASAKSWLQVKVSTHRSDRPASIKVSMFRGTRSPAKPLYLPIRLALRQDMRWFEGPVCSPDPTDIHDPHCPPATKLGSYSVIEPTQGTTEESGSIYRFTDGFAQQRFLTLAADPSIQSLMLNPFTKHWLTLAFQSDQLDPKGNPINRLYLPMGRVYSIRFSKRVARTPAAHWCIHHHWTYTVEFGGKPVNARVRCKKG